METQLLTRRKKIDGSFTLAGSKSINNRVLLLGALAKGTTHFTNVLSSNDGDIMIEGLETLGFNIQRCLQSKTLTIEGCSGKIPNGNFNLYLENAGTAVRSLTAAVALGRGIYRIDGNARMRERPIDDLVDALRLLGVKVEYENNSNCPPLNVYADGFCGGKTVVKGDVSSQYLTALLQAAPYAEKDVEIEVVGDLTSKPYIDMTIALMEKFGVKVFNENYQRFIVSSNQAYISPYNFTIEGDASSASYLLGAAAIGGEVTVYGCGRDSLQGEAGFANVMGLMGADVEYGDDYISVKSTGVLKGIDIDMNSMTDTGMTLAVVALFADGKTSIRNIANWRVKETERIKAVKTELQKLGAEVEEGDDYIVVHPPKHINSNITIDTYDDHRMAMAFSLASFGTEGLIINDPLCCSKTFPNYFDIFEKLTIKTEL